MRRSPIPFLLPALLAAVGCGSSSSQPTTMPPTEVVELREISDYLEMEAPEIYLRTTQDVLPGGLAAAMSPVRVNWEASTPDDSDGYWVIRNLNDGGNPMGGTTVLRSARVPANRIESVEFVLVPLDALGKNGLVAHGMLRFVFHDDFPGHLLGGDGDMAGRGAILPDLVLSWEAWRPPGVDFDFIKGMDPKFFDLCLRAHSGPQRFLEDALGKREWYSYTLRMPGDEEGFAELLRVTLVTGDGAAAAVMAKIFDQAGDSWLETGPAGAADLAALTQERESGLEQMSKTQGEDDRLVLDDEDQNYQTLLRSCSMMAVFNINVAVSRLLEAGKGEGTSMRPIGSDTMGDVEPWMEQMSSLSVGGMFAIAPEAAEFLSTHPEVVPTQVPQALKDARLQLYRDGKPVEAHYSMKKGTPYGAFGDALIR